MTVFYDCQKVKCKQVYYYSKLTSKPVLQKANFDLDTSDRTRPDLKLIVNWFA